MCGQKILAGLFTDKTAEVIIIVMIYLDPNNMRELNRYLGYDFVVKSYTRWESKSNRHHINKSIAHHSLY